MKREGDHATEYSLMNGTNCLATIILSAHNEEKYLGDSLNSLIKQSEKRWKLWLIIDKSTDNTLEIARRFSLHDFRIKVFESNHGNLGAVLSEYGAKVISPYLIRMDGDDIAYTHRIERQLAFMNMHPEIVVSGTQVRFIDESGQPFAVSSNHINHDDIYNELLTGRGGSIFHPTVIIRTEALHLVGGYRDKYKFGEDLDLYLRLSEVGKLGNINEILLNFRKHSKSSTHGEDISEAMLRRIDTINEHVARVGNRVQLPPVTRLVSQSYSDLLISRFYSSINFGYYKTAIIYFAKILSDFDIFKKLTKGFPSKFANRFTFVYFKNRIKYKI